MKPVLVIIIFLLLVIAACQKELVEQPSGEDTACAKSDLSVIVVIPPEEPVYAKDYNVKVEVDYDEGSCGPLSGYSVSLYDNNNLVEKKTISGVEAMTHNYVWNAIPEGEHVFKAKIEAEDADRTNNELSVTAEVIPVGYVDVSSGKYITVTGLDKKAHSFIPPIQMTLTGVDLYIKQFSDPSNTAYAEVQIRTDDNNKPSRTTVATARIYLHTIPKNFSWQNAKFSSPIVLESKRYWLFVVAGGSRSQFHLSYQPDLTGKADKNMTYEYSMRTTGPSYGLTDEYWVYEKDKDYNFKLRTT